MPGPVCASTQISGHLAMLPGPAMAVRGIPGDKPIEKPLVYPTHPPYMTTPAILEPI